MPIEAIDVAVYRIPTDGPEADGTLAWDATTMVLVRARGGGLTGLGYTYCADAAARLIADKLAPVVQGRDAFAVEAAWIAMAATCRNLGRPGLASYAIAAVDWALWDLKARLLGLPLFRLLGEVRPAVPAYGSGGFTAYSIDRMGRQLAGWAEQGLRAVKMKVGEQAGEDPERVREARNAIGPDAALFVDANGAYDRKQALAMAERFAEQGVVWFEEPVSSEDLAGLRLLRDRAPAGMDITAGEYGTEAVYFRRMLEAGAVDVLQPDATRCGGVTGFRLVEALCWAHQVPLSAHTAPALHVHVCCAAARARHLEYFHDHVRIERMLFDRAPRLVDGALCPDPARPGLGLSLNEKEAARYAQ